MQFSPLNAVDTTRKIDCEGGSASVAKIVYENEQAVLSFEYQDIVSALSSRVRQYDEENDLRLLGWLQQHSGNGEQSITIKGDHEYNGSEYVKRVIYVIGDLLTEGKGYVFCKECNKNVPECARKREGNGNEEPPKTTEQQVFTSLEEYLAIKGRLTSPSDDVGTTFCCNKGHELLVT
jgi:hypothetical protein